ncbi:hypothetical protein [Paenibacillus graminis]|uniref:hypothetical protein n=1 Tax=Paenibacillus graminis TaxID=189425 RepID=UPI002DBD58B1|nr:hypothetical protein [Paenibacillus graminis]MEC0173026.1 hypothetical protein [Paenibacillus graminis]
MTQYEVGKKYKKIVTVAKIHKDAPSVLMIDDMRYVLDPPRPDGKGGINGRKNKKKAGS